MQQQIIKQLAVKPLRWLLQKNITYWHQRSYRFRHSDSGYQFEPAENCGTVVIVSRSHYQEFIRLYPVAQLSDLKQILRTEYPQPGVLHYIGPEQDQRRTVCTVVLNAELLQQFNRLTVLIPESVLLWRALQPEYAVYQCNSFAGYFLYCAAAVPVSQQIGPFCPDFNIFALNNGIPDQALQRQLSQTSYSSALVKALASSVFNIHKLAVVAKPRFQLVRLPLKAIAITAAAVLLSYVAVVSSYYNLMLDNRQGKLAQLGDSVNQLLDTQQNVQQIAESANKLVELRQQKQASAHIWQVLLTLLQADASLQLQNLASESSRFVLRGEANQATQVLTSLQNSELVTDARFDAPVRRQRDKDAFVISLQLVQLQIAPQLEAADVTE
ncbi:hypothetical protein MN202_01155 [Rheinheimera muenzenbergensis]|uniref:General secretion pathway protein L n=1 Tax=Rheinheimera muenzenbergensis TaxID=1193628 RepID=A0ABU8C1N8_9GAMM